MSDCTRSPSVPTVGELRPTCSECDGDRVSDGLVCFVCGGLGFYENDAPTCNDVPAPPIDGVRSTLLGVLAARVEQRFDALSLHACRFGVPAPDVRLWDVYAEGARRHPTRRTPVACLPVRLPCSLCGHGLDEHDNGEDHDCMHVWCPCHGFMHGYMPMPTNTTRRTDATCADHCTCTDDCPAVGAFLVTARRADGAWVSLLGPYTTHSMALSMVDEAREMAHKRAAPMEAYRYSYGTACWKEDGPAPVGRLNDALAAEDGVA